MKDDALQHVARSVGLSTHWTDYTGEERRVSIESLRTIVDRLQPRQRPATPPPMRTQTVGEPLCIPSRSPSTHVHGTAATLIYEDGETVDLPLFERDGTMIGPAIERIGYHQLRVGDHDITLAVAPRRCFTVEDAIGNGKTWGLAAQIYALRRQGDGGIGDFAAVRMLAGASARMGADALALSPTHALFHTDPGHYSPYSPSSRLFRNPLHADLSATFDGGRIASSIYAAGIADRMRALEERALIDWPEAAGVRDMLFRALYESFRTRELSGAGQTALTEDFRGYCREAGGALIDHTRFEALHAHYLRRDSLRWHWKTWAPEHRDPRGSPVAAFAHGNRSEIEYHAFLQWLAARSQASSQAKAKAEGMRIGLIGDLAVGMNSGGSHAWSRQHDMLSDLSIGAPPDPLAPKGQDWGLTTFSPQGLIDSGFAPFIETLRSMFRHAGGIRIDHIMGLSRLWLIPDGADATAGAYLAYPFEDMLRLVALESWRHRAIVIGEDLGTVPHGFRQRLADIGIYGMRVIQFERNREGFHPPHWYQADAVAMTSTHDLPPVAGWWTGHDLAVREKLQQFGVGQTFSTESASREQAKSMFLSALRESADDTLTEDAAPSDIVRASMKFLARTSSRLALIPVEDLTGQMDQPNLPGTTTEHPNWRQRYSLPTDEILQGENMAALDGVVRERGR